MGVWVHGATAGLMAVSLAVAIAVPVTAFAVDGLALSPGWSIAHQNRAAAFGSTCGLADDIDVRDPAGGVESLADMVLRSGGSVLVTPNLRTLFPCFRQPAITGGVAEIPMLLICSAEELPQSHRLRCRGVRSLAVRLAGQPPSRPCRRR